MDVQRRTSRRASTLRYGLLGILCLAAVIGGAASFDSLRSAAPVVDRSTTWTDTVKRGLFVRQVRGDGSLIPERSQWIVAPADGRVERIFVQAGAPVGIDTVLLELSNPEVERSALEAQWQLTAARAELELTHAQMKDELLEMEANLARLNAEYEEAQDAADADTKLHADHLLSDWDWKRSAAKVHQLSELLRIARQQADAKKESQPARLAVGEARVAQAKALLEFRRKCTESLRVRAGTEGVLQQWEDAVQVGRQITTGLSVARICDPRQLKAVICVQEALARDVGIGQHAQIDTGGSQLSGIVTRVAPAARGGTVAVEVALETTAPQGARPDQTVVGAIDIERLKDVLYVARPANTYPQTTTMLFKVEGDYARAVRVSLGSSSASAIQILNGLREGDTIVLSDMAQKDGVDRIRLR